MENQQTRKGRGGPRPNSGGRRPGAGRPRKQPELVEVQVSAPDQLADDVELQEPAEVDTMIGKKRNPLEFLLSVMENNDVDLKIRTDAAKAAMPYLYPKKGEMGKKEQKQDNAEKIGAGKFKPAAPPLAIVKKTA